MSLYLGRIGRKILKYTVSHPRLDRAVDLFSNAAHKVLGDKYTPRLTRDMFLLSQRIQAGQKIEVRGDGFFKGKERLASNPFGKFFSEPVIIQLNSYTPETLSNYIRCVRAKMFDYSEGFGDPTDYVGYVLPKLLERSKTIEQLSDWDREAKALVSDYSGRFDDSWYYVRSFLPELLEQCKVIEEMREAKILVLDYSEKFGDPKDYLRFALLVLLDRCKTIEEIREAKALVLDYSERFGDPWFYVGDILPKHLEQCRNTEEFSKICKIAKELIKVSVNPSTIADILEITGVRLILSESHRDKFIRFCKNSGSNLANNIEFFRNLTSENADELFDWSVKYFQAMKTSLFLPLLFEEFRARDAEGKERLAQDFRNYYSSQVKGKTAAATELSEDIIEEINYSLVGSASLTREAYRRTLERVKGEAITQPNFDQIIKLELQRSQKKGSMPEKEIGFLKVRIGWIEEAVKLGDEIDDVEKAIADFPPTDRPGRKPTIEHTKKLMMLHLLKSYRSNPDLKTKIDELIEKRESISTTDPGVPERLIEVFKEIKPEAEAEVRRRMDGAVDVPRLEKIIGRFKKQRSEDIVTIELVPAKTELDYFYGYMGENCLSGYPEELLNPDFTPMRIVVNGKIMGSIHTLTLMIDGKKTLVLPGIEPKESLLAEVDAEEFTHAVIEKVIEEICKPEGYTRLCLSTKKASQSNRPPVASAIQKLIEGKTPIKQTVQSTFPQRSDYSIEELAVVWEARLKDS